jgi:hypothetical protein
MTLLPNDHVLMFGKHFDAMCFDGMHEQRGDLDLSVLSREELEQRYRCALEAFAGPPDEDEPPAYCHVTGERGIPAA